MIITGWKMYQSQPHTHTDAYNVTQLNACNVVPMDFRYGHRRDTRSRAGGIAAIHSLHNTLKKKKLKGNQH